MTPKLKCLLINIAKNATNAALVTLAPMFSAPDKYNWHTVSGVEHMGGVVLGAVLAREALVWGPKIAAWSTSSTEELQQAAAKKEEIAAIVARPPDVAPVSVVSLNGPANSVPAKKTNAYEDILK